MAAYTFEIEERFWSISTFGKNCSNRGLHLVSIIHVNMKHSCRKIVYNLQTSELALVLMWPRHEHETKLYRRVITDTEKVVENSMMCEYEHHFMQFTFLDDVCLCGCVSMARCCDCVILSNHLFTSRNQPSWNHISVNKISKLLF